MNGSQISNCFVFFIFHFVTSPVPLLLGTTETSVQSFFAPSGLIRLCIVYVFRIHINIVWALGTSALLLPAYMQRDIPELRATKLFFTQNEPSGLTPAVFRVPLINLRSRFFRLRLDVGNWTIFRHLVSTAWFRGLVRWLGRRHTHAQLFCRISRLVKSSRKEQSETEIHH